MGHDSPISLLQKDQCPVAAAVVADVDAVVVGGKTVGAVGPGTDKKRWRGRGWECDHPLLLQLGGLPLHCPRCWPGHSWQGPAPMPLEEGYDSCAGTK